MNDPLEQRMTALNTANERRTAAAQVKRDLADGTLTIEAALADPRAGCIKVGALLMAQPHWGRLRMTKALRGMESVRARVSDWRRVDELTDRQRQALVAVAGGTGKPTQNTGRIAA